MYYSFPNKYHVQVSTSEDFDYNHKGEVIDWNNSERKATNPMKFTEIQKLMDSPNSKDVEVSKILDEADEEYASKEAASK